MATFTGQDPCRVIDALAELNYDVLRRLNRKFLALRRLALLLEQIGDQTELVPNIGFLLPVEQINLNTYQALFENCPFLGLPEASNANLTVLKAAVIQAYAEQIRRLQNHPYLRLDTLQNTLIRFQNKVNFGGSIVENALTCLQSICVAAEEGESFFNKISNTDIAGQVATYTKNYVTEAGNVLTEGMQTKRDEVLTSIGRLEELSGDIVVTAQ